MFNDVIAMDIVEQLTEEQLDQLIAILEGAGY
jgi:hypothetical protein